MELKKLRKKLNNDYPNESSFGYFELKNERDYTNAQIPDSEYLSFKRQFYSKNSDKHKMALLRRLIFIDILILDNP